jgi:hypothetical protein
MSDLLYCYKVYAPYTYIYFFFLLKTVYMKYAHHLLVIDYFYAKVIYSMYMHICGLSHCS